MEVDEYNTTTFIYDGDGQLVKRLVDDGDDVVATAYLGDYYQVGPDDHWSTPQLVYGEQGAGQSWPNLSGANRNRRLNCTKPGNCGSIKNHFTHCVAIYTPRPKRCCTR
ncbi:MAG: hypothetical protein JXM69_19500 [Anaerolineae bacterium]|nr:hypothetical protein [Anaerolineae bacterium]